MPVLYRGALYLFTPAQQLQFSPLPDTAIDVGLNKPHLSPIIATFITNIKLNVILPSPSLSSNWPFRVQAYMIFIRKNLHAIVAIYY